MGKRGLIFAFGFIAIVFFGVVSANHLEDNEQISQIKEWSQDLVDYSEGGSSMSSLEIGRIALLRKKEMVVLGGEDSSVFLGLVLGDEIRNNLPDFVKENVEKRVEEEGNLVVVVIDSLEESEFIFSLETGKKIYNLYLTDIGEQKLRTTDAVRVKGYMLDEVIVVESFEKFEEGDGGIAGIIDGTHGEQDVDIVLVGFEGKEFDVEGFYGGILGVHTILDEVKRIYWEESSENMLINFQIYKYNLPYTFEEATDIIAGSRMNCLDALELLKTFRTEYNKGNLNFIPGDEKTTKYGIFNINFCSTTIGIAYVGTAGSLNYNVAISQSLGRERGLEPILISHEYGHNRGLFHDASESRPRYIMYPSLSSFNLDEFNRDNKIQFGWPLERIDPGPVPGGCGLVCQLRRLIHAYVSQPDQGEIISGNVEIVGSIIGGESGRNWELKVGPGVDPSEEETSLISSGRVEANEERFDEILANWDTREFEQGMYTLRISVEQFGRSSIRHSVRVFVTNEIGGFIRGDANIDGKIDISDTISVLGYLFMGNPEKLQCNSAGDVNEDEQIDISDAVGILRYLFQGDNSLGLDEECIVGFEKDGLSCEVYPAQFCPIVEK